MSWALQSLLLDRFDLRPTTYIRQLCLKLKLNFLIFIEHIYAHTHKQKLGLYCQIQVSKVNSLYLELSF